MIWLSMFTPFASYVDTHPLKHCWSGVHSVRVPAIGVSSYKTYENFQQNDHIVFYNITCYCDIFGMKEERKEKEMKLKRFK